MKYKAQKQGVPSLQLNTGVSGTNLKRKESMSANDREALERSKDVAAASKGDYDNNNNNNHNNRHSSSIAAAAVPVHNDIHQNMDVDALERELGGGI